MTTNTRHRLPFRAAGAAMLVAALITPLAASPSGATPNPNPAALPAPPAQFPNLARSTSTSALNSVSKAGLVSCPLGTVVVGAGVHTQSLADVRLNDMIPDGNEVRTFGYEDDSNSATNWDLMTQALCANAPFGYETVSAISTHSSAAYHVATASCSGGKDLIGTGWAIQGGNGHVGVTMVIPDMTTDDVLVRADEDELGWSGLWNVSAYAICAAGITGETVVTIPTPSTSADHYSSSACPPGKVALGSGFSVLGGHQRHSALASLHQGGPYNGRWLQSVTVAEDDAGTPNSWSLQQHQICANP